MSVRARPAAVLAVGGLLAAAAVEAGQSLVDPAGPSPAARAATLRGAYGPARANNDLLSYRLRVRVDPAARRIAGSNRIRFRMLEDASRIQLDLDDQLTIDRVSMGRRTLVHRRDGAAFFVEFPDALRAGRTYTVEVSYSGTPRQVGRFGGFVFGTDPAGRPWIYTACEDEGASIWWPNKDQWRDEVESMEVQVEAPDPLVAVSNGRLRRREPLGDGFTRWTWRVSYPINGYGVALNIGHYVREDGVYNGMPLTYYTLPEDQARSAAQFAQVPGMLEAFERVFGPYPFRRDGYKLIQVPYAGMEHQSAVAYGNGFANGYLGRDFTGVGISPRFDFIIVHESAHEYFGNAVTAADVADMWIHEAWATYLESLYVEARWGHADMLAYTNGYRAKVRNRVPILQARGRHQPPPDQDQYFKGTLFLNTLRSVVDDDAQWFGLLRRLFQTFKYRTILTEDIVAVVSDALGTDVAPLFDQYLRHADLPTLELAFDTPGAVRYRWRADVPGFAMPVRVGRPAAWTVVRPTSEWQTLVTPVPREAFAVAEDRYYIGVERR